MNRSRRLIISNLRKYDIIGNYGSEIELEGEWVKITMDNDKILNRAADFKRVIALREKRKFSEAEPLLQKDLTNSEYYRIMGQIYSDEGEHDKATNYLIDALRWNPKNGWALLTMGHIFAKFKDDVSTAMKYYDQALIANPGDSIIINNISAYPMQQGKIKDVKKYFQRTLEINSQYPHTHFAMRMVAESEGNLQDVFNHTIQAIKSNKVRDVLYRNSVKQAIELAPKIVTTDAKEKIRKFFKNKLESEGGQKIEEVKDEKIPTAVGFEFAEVYHIKNYIIRYKPNYPIVEHLIMRELVRSYFVIQARRQGVNQLFTNRAQFIKGLEATIKRLQKMNVDQTSIDGFCFGLFYGVNSQTYNTSIDPFIEQFFEGKTKDEIKKITPEIAMFGARGYSPDKDEYIISSLPGKIFSGYHNSALSLRQLGFGYPIC